MNQDGTQINPQVPNFSGSDNPPLPPQNIAPQAPTQQTPAPQTPVSQPISSDPSFAARVAAAPGQDDIVYSDGDATKAGGNRKILIIGGIVIGILVIAIVAVLIANPQLIGGKKNYSAKQLFNAYADYIVNGGSSVDFELGDYDPSVSYVAISKILLPDEAKDYVKEALNKYEQFYKAVEKYDINSAKHYYYDLQFVADCYGIGDIDRTTLKGLITGLSLSDAEATIENHYASYATNETADYYKDKKIKYYTNYVDYRKSEESCTEGDLERCDEDTKSRMAVLNSEMNEYLEQATNAKNTAILNILTNLWTVRDELREANI